MDNECELFAASLAVFVYHLGVAPSLLVIFASHYHGVRVPLHAKLVSLGLKLQQHTCQIDFALLSI